jgi:hypothetical protein
MERGDFARLDAPPSPEVTRPPERQPGGDAGVDASDVVPFV